MANQKILDQKQVVIDEITNNVKESSSFILLENHGLTVAEMTELRRILKESDSELKKLATIPSREGLLTMFASGLLAIPRDFAICLDLHSKNLEG